MKAGWEVKALGDVCEIVNGGTPKSAVSEYWGGEVQWLTPKDMGKLEGYCIAETPRKITELGLAKCSAKLAPAESLIMSTRAPIGHLAINTTPMAFNQGCRALVPSKGIDLKYLFYWMSANVRALNDLGTGATFKELGAGALKGFEIPLPPLDEQKRIVAVLDAAFEGLTRARTHVETNLQNARELFESELSTVFDSIVVNSGSQALIDVCLDRGITYGVIKLGGHIDGGVPCLRTSNVKPLFIETEGMKHISQKLSDEYSRTILKGCEVLVNVRGTLGGVCVVPPEMRGWNVSREVAMVDVDQELAHSAYVALFIATKKAQAWLTGVLKGAAYKGINLIDLRKLMIPMPSKLKQLEVIADLEAKRQTFKDLLSIYETKLKDLDDLRQSLLQKAFAGDLT